MKVVFPSEPTETRNNGINPGVGGGVCVNIEPFNPEFNI